MPATKTRQSRTSHSRVPFADADRVRRHLLSESVTVLTTKDIKTMLRIINDVYPPGRSSARSRSTVPAGSDFPPRWHPFLWGVGIGVVLLILAISTV